MKWQPVNKKLLIFILAMTLGLAMAFAWHSLYSPGFMLQKHNKTVKIGFVDLMAHQQEVYRADIQILDDCILTTITQPDDKDFIIKGNLVEVKKNKMKLDYKFSPVFISLPSRPPMITEYIEQLTHTDILIQPKSDAPGTLMIGQEGVVIPL